MKQEKLNFTTKLAYGSGDMGPAITANILVFFLLYFFTNVAGLPPGMAGSILAIGKIGDAINDPIAGILSDRTRTKWGRRIPWMLFGTIPFGVFFFLQWLVPTFSSDPNTNNWYLFAYYIVVATLFNLAYTAVNLPYTALTPELTQDYNERTNLNSFRFAFSIGGSILSLILAGFISQAYPNDPLKEYFVLGLSSSLISMIAIFWATFRIQEKGSQPILNQQLRKTFGFILSATGIVFFILGIYRVFNDININLYGVLGILIGLQITLFGITLIFSKTESHLCDAEATLHRQSTQQESSIPIKEQLKIAFRNKPFLYVIGIYLSCWLAVQLTASILIYYVVSCMKMDKAAFPTVAIAVQGTALVMLFVWKYISEKIGKRSVFFIGTVIWIVAQGGLFLLQPGQTRELYLLAGGAGIGVSVAYLIPWSMIPDVIELDELNTGQRREGIFYSFMVLLQKFGLALALFLVGQALEWSGFIEASPGEAIPVQPDTALLAIRIAVAPLPAIILVFGLVIAYFYPITKEVHADIRAKIQAKKQVS